MNNKKSKDISIAYICLCHTDPNFIARVAKTLIYKDDKIFIHVDNKQDISPYLDACKDISGAYFV